MQTTRFIGCAIAFHEAVIRMMGKKEIPSEVDQEIRYGRTQDSTGSHDSSGRRSKEEIESKKVFARVSLPVRQEAAGSSLVTPRHLQCESFLKRGTSPT